MGGGLSIEQADTQNISNKISQSSIEQCSIANTASQNIQIDATGGSLNNDNFKNGILSNNTSCALKASFSTTLLNNLNNTQGATQFDVPGIFTILNSLAGNKDNINQSNAQNIANEATQAMNSLCQNNDTAPQVINLNINGTNISNTTFGNFVKSNKFSCTLTNMASFYAQNSEINSQSALQIQVDSMVFIAIIICVAVIAVAALKYGSKKKGNNNSNDNSDNKLIDDIIKEPAPIPNSKRSTISNPFSRKKV
jgi:hypothetical protein